jgi:membrane associated rhomboid family serine protease
MDSEEELSGPRPFITRLIIMLNICVFAMWMFYDLDFMTRNFTVSWVGLTEGRVWTLITSVFSHNLIFHIAINMFVLNSFGSIVETVLGPWRYIKFYLAAGVVSSLTHALVSAYLIGEPEMAAVGASGSIAGLVLLFSLLFPREKILLFGIIPLPAIIGALAFIGLDIWGLVAQTGGGGLPIGHGAHLGGAFSGIFYYLWLRRRRLKRD